MIENDTVVQKSLYELKNDKVVPFDELTVETSYSSSCGPVSGEWTSYSGSFEKSVASRSDTTRSSRSSRSYGEPIHQADKDSYHQMIRPIKRKNPITQLSSRRRFDAGQRNELCPSRCPLRRSATPTPRRATPMALSPRSLTPNICDRLKGMGVHLKQERIRRKAVEEMNKSDEMRSYSDPFDPETSVTSRSDTTRSSRSYKSSQSSLITEQTYAELKNSYHQIDRTINCENSTRRFSSQGRFDGQRNNFNPSQRSVTPTPRRVQSGFFPFKLSSQRDLDYCNDFHPSKRSATPPVRSVPMRIVAPRSLTPNICERLYKMGVHTQRAKVKDERTRKKIAEEEEIKKQNNPLQINRSYTPQKLRPYEIVEKKYKKFASVHDYLYKNATERKMEHQTFKERAATPTRTERNRAKKLLSPRENNEVMGRLYGASKEQQNDGKERRMKIAKALAPRPILPKKTISVANANITYNRLVAQKKIRDMKLQATRNIRQDRLDKDRASIINHC